MNKNAMNAVVGNGFHGRGSYSRSAAWQLRDWRHPSSNNNEQWRHSAPSWRR